MRKRVQVGVVLLLIGTVLPAYAQDQAVSGNAPPAALSGAGDTGKAAVPATDDPNYVIGAQDVLDINVWKEPDVSRSVPVRPDGKISLPLINDIQAAGLTPLQLSSNITAGLTKYMTNPQVTVIVSQINSQRIYVLGQVTRPGAFLLLPDMTVLQAISNAGGPTIFANVKRISVIRVDKGKQGKMYFDYKSVVSGKHPEQNIVLKPGDTLYVP